MAEAAGWELHGHLHGGNPFPSLILHERAYGQVSVFGKLSSFNGISDLNSELCLTLLELKLGRAKSKRELLRGIVAVRFGRFDSVVQFF